MAWTYQISLECGTDPAAVSICKEYFESVAGNLENAFISGSTDDDGGQWISIGIDQRHISEAQWAQISDEYWNEALFRLPFRYGFAGLEVDQLRTYSELAEEDDFQGFEHFAISEDALNSLGKPSFGHLKFGKYAR